VRVSLEPTLRSLRRFAGTGPDGARNAFWFWRVVGAADFRAGSRAEAAMGLLDEFAAAWISAALPPWFDAAASEVRLVAAVKPGSPPDAPDARPVAPGGTLRRTIERASMASVRSNLADRFWPLNVGCAVPGGISVLTLGFNLLAYHRPDLVFLKIDLRNAHNWVLRRAMVQAAYDAGGRIRIRALVPLLWATLSAKSAIIILADRANTRAPFDLR